MIIIFFVSKSLEKNCKFFKLMFHILGGQNFKLDSYTDVVRPATNVSIEFFIFTEYFQVLTNKNIFFGFYYSITNRKRKMLEININARFAPGELMEELEEILDSFPSKLFHPKWYVKKWHLIFIFT